ncbi:MAG TPA: hypothetical protein VHA74_02475, partial [Candidatus Dojkabacteria bacterium]|nr:hypothetical protein [Candidatus Dojkabacteria bacterium]
NPYLELVIYYEVEDNKMNWLWIEPTVNDEELKQALAQSIDKSKTKLPDDEGAINEARKNRQSSIIDDLIG